MELSDLLLVMVLSCSSNSIAVGCHIYLLLWKSELLTEYPMIIKVTSCCEE